MSGWRQRVVLASECGRLALVAVDVISDSKGGRRVLIRPEEQPPLRLHNLTPNPLYITEREMEWHRLGQRERHRMGGSI